MKETLSQVDMQQVKESLIKLSKAANANDLLQTVDSGTLDRLTAMMEFELEDRAYRNLIDHDR